jgi:membrane-associated phospholipid phosphatase
MRLNRGEADLVDRALPSGQPSPMLVCISRLADGSRLWFAVAAVMAICSGHLRRAALEGTVAALLAAGCTQILNRLVGRPRPPADHPARAALGRQPVTPSFPSSHTAVAAAFVTAVGRRNRRAGALLTPLALTLAYGRIRLRMHWSTDVVGGAVLGAGAGRFAGRLTAAARSAGSAPR